MKSIFAVLIPLLVMCISGCDKSFALSTTGIPGDDVEIVFGPGVLLSISETQDVLVFGNDRCPVGNSDWLFRSEVVGGTGCTILTGRDLVRVFFVIDGQRIQEEWLVEHEEGSLGHMVRIKRPNGWIVHQPIDE